MANIIVDIRLLSKGGSSGIEEYTCSLVDKLLELDGENRYTFFYNGFNKVPLSEARPGSTITNRRIPNKLLDFSLKFLQWPKIENLTSANHQDSLIFSPHFNIIRTKLPHVMTFHDLSFLHYPEFFPIRKKFWHWMQDYKNQARKAQKIIAVSEFTKSDLVDFLKIPEEKIKIIYSGVNPSFRKLLPDDAGLLAAKEKYNLKRPFILYLGTIEPRKNVIALIHAFNLLKDAAHFKELELVIAGGIGWLSEETMREARSSKYCNDIKFIGVIPTGERVHVYNLASVFAYPSFFEGFGFPPLEAQACGVPVVASNRTSLPEILGDSAALIDPWRVLELADAVRKILLSSQAKEDLTIRGYENAKKFSWDKTARETIKLLV
ncbi:MAG: glycosyltransferase family 4 protein [Candidatus Liptonbacteria bacterium]|nr:glycosyltransferase family 4 protein [Candidatus Liptonbacteria bacterium]